MPVSADVGSPGEDVGRTILVGHVEHRVAKPARRNLCAWPNAEGYYTVRRKVAMGDEPMFSQSLDAQARARTTRLDGRGGIDAHGMA